MSKLALAASAGLALAATANAQMFVGGGGPLVDGIGTPPTSTPGVFTSSINVVSGGTIANMSVGLVGLQHTWAGDLHITISNGVNSVDLVNRVGSTVPGQTTFGDSSNYNGTYEFNDANAGDLWAAAAAAPLSDSIIAPGQYFASTTGGVQNSLNAVFGGQSSTATWTLTIRDFAGADTGSLGSWFIVLEKVPAPGAAALLGLAGVAGLRRRR